MKSMAVIFARGGSKGVPRKALKDLGGHPLISYTIRDALQIPEISKVHVNTDDPEIREVSLAYGAEVPFLRPPQLATDTALLTDALAYTQQWYSEHLDFKADIEIVMSPTYPFRRNNLIKHALQIGLDDETIFNIGSVAPVYCQHDNFWQGDGDAFNRFPMFVLAQNNHTLFQSALSFNIVFYCRPNTIQKRIPYLLNDIESIDIDETLDLHLARQVIEKGLYPINE